MDENVLDDPRLKRLATRAVQIYPWHRLVFITLNGLITAINIWTGPPWWGLWPLVITGAVFIVHFLIYRVVTIDEQWVDERAVDVYDRSYDQGHIANIAGRHDMETPLERTERELRERRARRLAKRKSRTHE